MDGGWRVDDGGELDKLRRELQARFESYPARYWSASLLAAMIAVLDMEIRGDGGDGGLKAFRRRRHLRVVR